LHFFRLEQEGLANLYYAAGVKSMMMNWHNFFFVSFDPGGFITIDKPPLGFWIQTISAKIFGFQGWSIILPQALGGVTSVYLIYVLVKRYHGEWAGLISALVLALTPIFVAASRNNTIDVLLVTTLLFSVLVFLPATEELSLKKLLLAFFLIGVGFNIKSLEACMILPAFYITYLFTQYGQFRKKAIHLLVATLVLLVSSLPWFIAVDSISPEDRPYVGSSGTNSELELATGYNGLGHFLGYGIRTPGRQGQAHNPRRPTSPNGVPPGVNAPSLPPPSTGTGFSAANDSNSRPNLQPFGNMRQPGGETGLPGPFRLFNHQMAGQISWLLPFALIGLVIALYQIRRQALPEKTRMKLLFWGCWLIPQAVFFSIAQGAHRYYLVMMAPAIAALVGISYSTLAANWSTGAGKSRYLLPVAILSTIGVQAFIIAGYNEWRSWMLPTVIGVGLLAALLLGWKATRGKVQENRGNYLAIIVSIISILIAPFAWSLTPVLYGSGNSAFPFAGPDLNPQSRQSDMQWGMVNFSGWFTGTDTSKLEDFLIMHRNGEKYIVAVPNAHTASSLILNTGEPIITYGGFMGSEKILNGEKLEELVASGQVRYIMIGAANSQQPDIDVWVSSHGVPVPDIEWRTPEQKNTVSNGVPASTRNMSLKLYDCHI
jgi:4-amino-4-deoxy-L-arabinose transferase-like glycosyltransferase